MGMEYVVYKNDRYVKLQKYEEKIVVMKSKAIKKKKSIGTKC